MKRMMCLLLIILCMVVSAASSSAFTLQRSRVYQSADDSGAYEIRIDGQHAEITKYLTGSFSVGLNLSHTICAACAYHGKAVLFCPDDHNNQLIIYVYDLATDYLDSFAVYGMKLLDNTDFGCDDSAIYIENYRDSCELLAYSYSGNLLDRYRFNSEINAVCGAYDSGTYIVSGNELNIIRSGSVHAVTGGEVHAPLFPADFGMIASAYGQVYRLDGDRIASSFSVETDYKAVSACVIGHTLYYPCGNTIDGYDLDTGEKTSYYTLNENASLLYADADRIVAVGDSSFITIYRDDFISLKPPVSDDGNNEDNAIYTPGSHRSESNEPHNEAPDTISSDSYQVDHDRYRITGISPGTTVAGFLSHMHYNGYTAAVYRDGSQKTGGNVGTAMTVVFSSDHGSITFELGVTGDLTGEGNLNSRDLNLLLDYMIGAADFNGVYMDAADLDTNGTVDIADAALMKRRIG